MNLKRISAGIALICMVLPVLCSCSPPEKPEVSIYEQYLELINEKKYSEASLKLQALVDEDKADWRVYHYLAICCEKTGRRYKAIEYYSRAIVLADNYRPYYRLGILYIEIGEYDKALNLLRKVKSFYPDFVEGRFYLAIAAFFNARIEESLDNFKYIVDKEKYNPGSLAMIGRIKYFQGNPLQAVGFLLQSIEYAPEWSWGRFQLGTIYMRMGKIDAAIGQFKAAVKYDSENYQSMYHLALMYDKKGMKEEADKLFDKLLGLENENETIGIIQSSIYLKRGDFVKAEQILVAMLSSPGQHFEVYKRLGYIYASKMDDKERGLLCFREALKDFPDDIPVRYQYAVLLKDTGRGEEAERQFDEILEINPVSAEGYFLQGIIYGRKGDFDKAEVLIKRAVELDRFNSEGRRLLVQILLNNNKLVEAASIAEEILLLNPDNRVIKSLLARIFAGMGSYQRSVELLKSMIDWDNPAEDDIENIHLLHSVYLEAGRQQDLLDLERRMKELGLEPESEQTSIE